MTPFKEPVFITRPILPDLEELHVKFKGIWESKWLTNNGEQHKLLEKKLQIFLKVPYLSLFNNGTIALIVACRFLKISGEVITTPFTFPATTHVLTWNNIKPVFCDIDPVTMNLDADKIESLITRETNAILGVHIFGTPCDVFKIQEIAYKHSLKVIYDAAHAFGVEINGQGIGTFGDISMFSFHATKLFHSIEGGALTFNDMDFKYHIDMLKNFGIKNEEEVLGAGINGKMTEIHSAIGLLVLNYVEEEKRKRECILKCYRTYLRDIEGISFLSDISGTTNSYQYFVIRIDEKKFGLSRDEVYDKFKVYNIFTRKYFYPLCSNFDCYKYLPSSDPKKLPVARKVASEVLCLPFYGELSLEDVARICDILKSFKR
ncbi:MAG: DegT/DnrJ/EryC1/StrS family aminotransferase [Desulfobacterales bacterium]|nr:DegT/DnrJ/EryC1/StrS family aminotransferase [Desulfobacterales bacterium]MBF0395612.1 DegT/DnrJ/EryC1/StrS family aminotransferase [Desulfobacterales bacterium]